MGAGTKEKEKTATKRPPFSFIIHPFHTVPVALWGSRSLRSSGFLTVLCVLHHVCESHQRFVVAQSPRLPVSPSSHCSLRLASLPSECQRFSDSASQLC